MTTETETMPPTDDDHRTAGTGPVQRSVRRAGRVLLFAALIASGAFLWICGLAVLGVSADLPQWRHVIGAALIALSVFVWSKA